MEAVFISPRLILASASPRRSRLLRELGLAFDVIPSTIDESVIHDPDPAELVKLLSAAKAQQVAEAEGDGIVIGSDTIVVLDGKVLGKPESHEDAVRMLRMLSGRVHQVYSGVCVVDAASGRKLCDCSVTDVRFRELSDDTIQSYIRTGEPDDKAGAYAIQGFGSLLVESICGDYFTVVGLPVGMLAGMLDEFGVRVL